MGSVGKCKCVFHSCNRECDTWLICLLVFKCILWQLSGYHFYLFFLFCIHRMMLLLPKKMERIKVFFIASNKAEGDWGSHLSLPGLLGQVGETWKPSTLATFPLPAQQALVVVPSVSYTFCKSSSSGLLLILFWSPCNWAVTIGLDPSCSARRCLFRKDWQSPLKNNHAEV